MKSAAFTIKVFGTYVIVTGLGVMLIPALWLSLLGLPPPNEIWVRVLGLVTCVLGVYYWANGLANYRPFFVSSLYGRSIFCAGCIGLVVFASAPWQLIILGVIDLAGAAWTKMALAHESPA